MWIYPLILYTYNKQPHETRFFLSVVVKLHKHNDRSVRSIKKHRRFEELNLPGPVRWCKNSGPNCRLSSTFRRSTSSDVNSYRLLIGSGLLEKGIIANEKRKKEKKRGTRVILNLEITQLLCNTKNGAPSSCFLFFLFSDPKLII